MGIFWDLIQQSQIQDHKTQAESLEIRVRNLERELYETRQILTKTLEILEKQTGKDLNGDGKIG